jgi:N utilization substance protein B
MLYQLDVGKLPLSELWEGALAQARLPLENAIQQAVRQCEADLRARVKKWEADGAIVPRSTKLTSGAMVAVVRSLAADASEAMKCALSPSPVADVTSAFAMVAGAAERARADLERLAARDRFEADRMAELAAATAGHIRALVHAFEHALPPCYEVTTFAVRLVKGVQERMDDIDAILADTSPGWSQERQVAVDRSILRLATYEMRFMPEVPTGATINEAVELAKKYSTAESPRFVNGVLGALVSAAPEDHR